MTGFEQVANPEVIPLDGAVPTTRA